MGSETARQTSSMRHGGEGALVSACTAVTMNAPKTVSSRSFRALATRAAFTLAAESASKPPSFTTTTTLPAEKEVTDTCAAGTFGEIREE